MPVLEVNLASRVARQCDWSVGGACRRSVVLSQSAIRTSSHSIEFNSAYSMGCKEERLTFSRPSPAAAHAYLSQQKSMYDNNIGVCQ